MKLVCSALPDNPLDHRCERVVLWRLRAMLRGDRTGPIVQDERHSCDGHLAIVARIITTTNSDADHIEIGALT